MTVLGSVGEGIGDALLTEIPGTSINVAYGLGVGLVILGGIALARTAFKNTFKSS